MRTRFLFMMLLCCSGGLLSAQSLTKEAMNNFALYTNKGEFSDLEKARKSIDEAYKTRKDSFSYKNNLIRSLVYSSLAFADSTRRLSYKKDPINETLFSLNRLKSPKLNDEHKPELDYVKTQLAKAWLIKANKAITVYNYPEAYKAYLSVDSLNSELFFVKHNLALLSEKMGNISRAINYYEQLVEDRKRSLPDYYLALSNLYESRNSNKSLEVLQEGRRVFPGNKDLLFKEINIYADNGAYNMVENIVLDALKLDPDNSELNYLAGFSYDMTGKKAKAEEYYKRVISLEYNNYEGNYSLGLLYLNWYLNSANNKEVNLNLAKKYLTLAGEINPNSVNVLKSLAILYNSTGDMIELEKVNNKLKQFILIN
ncbi:tetratricopeptide repeat protein [Arcticibacter tournemirensis]|uniref:Tetratricopeptide repeat protein n=1 Tax=Arcticibacter tournemirensis TaxID=699437 RepID=A0A5M9GUX0_9SPHI|nr:tetratricopeptide repeat protein [Arcticibacter tournemirensis]